MSLSGSHAEAIQTQLAEEESIIDYCVAGHAIAAVTDRRILQVTKPESERRDARRVDSVLLTGPNVVGVTVDERSQEAPDWVLLGVSVLLGIIGAGLVFSGNGDMFIGGGVALLIAAAFFAYRGLDRAPGGIYVSVNMASGATESVVLPLDATSVASAISRQIAEVHTHEMKVVTP